MINFKFDTSNNFTFPADERKVMLLLNGEYYRMAIDKNTFFEDRINRLHVNAVEITYQLYKEDVRDAIGFVIVRLTTELDTLSHKIIKRIGHKEIPNDFFEIERIELKEDVRVKGIGTALINYVISDVIKFNKLHGTNLPILIEQLNTTITWPFYKKFGARENLHSTEIYTSRVCDITTPLIIDNPTTYGSKEFMIVELADNFNYEKVGKQNPFTSKTRKI